LTDSPGSAVVKTPGGSLAAATLTVTRSHPQDVQDRIVNLWLDGEPLGKLKYGTTVTREIEPGVHTLKAHNTLFGTTATFDAGPGEQVRYRCQNGLTSGGIVMVLMLGVAYLRVRLEREVGDS
jgi:FtsP/CotA-like multicopper oxidase with cupredoxin domain